MSKYLVKVKYNADGVRGLQKEGGSARVAAITKLAKNMGGKVESFYFATGDVDAYLIMDVADPTSVVALSLAVNASGVVAIQTVPLITAKQMDEATRKTVKYKAPGA